MANRGLEHLHPSTGSTGPDHDPSAADGSSDRPGALSAGGSAGRESARRRLQLADEGWGRPEWWMWPIVAFRAGRRLRRSLRAYEPAPLPPAPTSVTDLFPDSDNPWLSQVNPEAAVLTRETLDRHFSRFGAGVTDYLQEYPTTEAEAFDE